MTVSELIQRLQEFPPYAMVFAHKAHMYNEDEESTLYNPVEVTGAFDRGCDMNGLNRHIEITTEDE